MSHQRRQVSWRSSPYPVWWPGLLSYQALLWYQVWPYLSWRCHGLPCTYFCNVPHLSQALECQYELKTQLLLHDFIACQSVWSLWTCMGIYLALIFSSYIEPCSCMQTANDTVLNYLHSGQGPWKSWNSYSATRAHDLIQLQYISA